MDFKKEYLGEWIIHDDNSCSALKEYDRTADNVLSPARHMREIADRYETTIEEMKNHWRCIPLDERERHALKKYY